MPAACFSLQGSVPKPRGASRLKKERNRLLRDDDESDGESDDESDYDPDVILSEADWKQAVARKPNRPKVAREPKAAKPPAAAAGANAEKNRKKKEAAKAKKLALREHHRATL